MRVTRPLLNALYLSVLLTFLQPVLVFSAVNEASIRVGTTTSLNKVFQDRPYRFNGKYNDVARIAMARNEYEATQIVIFPNRSMQNLSVKVSSLLHKNGRNKIPVKNIEVNIIAYIELVWPEIANNRKGFYPDPLLPNQSINLKKGSPQPFLITVYTPMDTLAGEYQGKIEVIENNSILKTLKLSVNVWDITLPKVSRFKTTVLTKRQISWYPWPLDRGYKWPSPKVQEQRFMKLSELAFRNRLPFTAFIANGLDSYNWKGNGGTSYGFPTHDGEERGPKTFNPKRTDAMIDYMLSKGANHFFIALTSDIYKYSATAKEREKKLLDYLRDVVPHLRKRGLMDKVYVYNVDEPWDKAVDHAKKTYELIKKEIGADVRIMQNMNQNNDTVIGKFLGYYDAADINLGFYKINKTDRYREKHPKKLKDLWWNVNVWPVTRPNLFIEYPLIDARILGPMSYKHNMSGFEYWDLFSLEGILSYSPLKKGQVRLNWKIQKGSLDGCLIYPSEDFGYYSSLRFESFRDGMEDQELLFILEGLNPKSRLLNVPIVRDIENYTQSARDLLMFRQQVAEAIVQQKNKVKKLKFR